MKLRHIALVLALVALMVIGLASCGVVPPQGSTNPSQGTTAPQGDMYTVTFDGVDGVPSQLVAAGNPVQKPANPEKENYSFDGWYVNGEKWNFNKPVEGNLTLTAKFSPKSFAITYNLGGVDAENPNPDTYAYSEDADLYLAPLSAEGMFFLGWSKPAIEAGTSGEVEVTARWIAANKVLRAYGFEANAENGKTYIHYSEGRGTSDDESSWWDAPNGTKQSYWTASGTPGGAGLYIQAVWAPLLNHSTGVSVFEGWKSEKTLPLIEYGYNADGEIVNAWLSSTYGPSIVTGFEEFTKDEPYSVSAFFAFTGVAEAGVEDVVINVDFRMKGETAFPINFYLRGGSNYDNGQNRVNAFAIDGNGEIVVGEDTIDARRVVYVDGNGNKINKKGIGNVGDGKWHTISLEMSQSSVGYDVVIKVDGVKLGDTLSMKTNINFSGENALTQLMIFGGNKATVAQVEALGDDYKCTCEFDNFVIYAK